MRGRAVGWCEQCGAPIKNSKKFFCRECEKLGEMDNEVKYYKRRRKQVRTDKEQRALDIGPGH